MQKIVSFIKANIEVVVCAVLMLAFVVLSALLPSAWIFPTGLVLLLLLLGYLTYSVLIKHKRLPASTEAALSTLTVDALMQLPYPVLMIYSDDTVAWYNRAFSNIKEFADIKYGQNIRSIKGGALSYSVLKNQKNEFVFETEGKSYVLHIASVATYDKQYLLTIWNDQTPFIELQKLLKMRNVVIGYAAIDNAAEVSSYIQEHYRSMVAKAYTEVYNWVSDMHGIMREYDRDKYIIIIDEENFTPNIAKKFDILDRVNSAIAGNSNRLTMSMSFAVVEGSLAEKEAAAKDALEYAFQRGGAQVIVKNKDGNLSFGGQSRAVEKTTKIKSRVTAERLNELITNSDNVLIMGHKNIDFDAIAAACGVARLVMSLETKVNIIVNPDDSALQTVMPLIKPLKEYDHVFIDRSRGQELLMPSTLVVVVDASNPKIFEAFDVYENAQSIAIIDHHVQTSEFDVQPKLQYIDPTASSASELVCEILEQAIPRNALKQAEAELLLAGILLDTQKFTRNTGVRTFGAAMYLRPDAKMLQHAQGVFKPHIHEYTKQAVFQKNTIIFHDCIAISFYDDDEMQENRVMASVAAESMLSIVQVKAAFAICTIGKDIHISARSDGSINVAKITERLGGGGRFEAAAAVLKETDIKSAMMELRNAIDEYFEDNMNTGGVTQ